MVLFLMVMGNIPILYQNGTVDASKKYLEMKKKLVGEESGGKSVQQWVEMKNCGLKIVGILGGLTY